MLGIFVVAVLPCTSGLPAVGVSGVVLLLPPFWEAGRKHRMQRRRDFFRVRYAASNLSALVALLVGDLIVPSLVSGGVAS